MPVARKKKLKKESRDSTVIAYAKENGYDPESFLRGWKQVKERGNKK